MRVLKNPTAVYLASFRYLLSTAKGLFPQVFLGFLRFLPNFYGFLGFFLLRMLQTLVWRGEDALPGKDVA
jgi:hypothetical protein